MTDIDATTEPDPARADCAVAQSALQRLLDREAEWDTPEAAAHRAGCGVCREELALARSIHRLAVPVVVPSELSGRVLNASLAAHRRRELALWAVAGLTVAAAVVIGLAVNPPRPAPDPDLGQVVVVPPPMPDEPQAVAMQKPLGESVSEAADAIVTLTKRTANEPRERITILLPEPRLVGPGEPDERLEPLADAGTGAARSVEPLKDSARRAINFFVRTADPPSRQ
jgi:hypothetical protein